MIIVDDIEVVVVILCSLRSLSLVLMLQRLLLLPLLLPLPQRGSQTNSCKILADKRDSLQVPLLLLLLLLLLLQ